MNPIVRRVLLDSLERTWLMGPVLGVFAALIALTADTSALENQLDRMSMVTIFLLAFNVFGPDGSYFLRALPSARQLRALPFSLNQIALVLLLQRVCMPSLGNLLTAGLLGILSLGFTPASTSPHRIVEIILPSLCLCSALSIMNLASIVDRTAADRTIEFRGVSVRRMVVEIVRTAPAIIVMAVPFMLPVQWRPLGISLSIFLGLMAAFYFWFRRKDFVFPHTPRPHCDIHSVILQRRSIFLGSMRFFAPVAVPTIVFGALPVAFLLVSPSPDQSRSSLDIADLIAIAMWAPVAVAFPLTTLARSFRAIRVLPISAGTIAIAFLCIYGVLSFTAFASTISLAYSCWQIPNGWIKHLSVLWLFSTIVAEYVCVMTIRAPSLAAGQVLLAILFGFLMMLGNSAASTIYTRVKTQ